MTLNHLSVFQRSMEAMGTTLEEIQKRDRRLHVVNKRSVVAWLLRETGLSLPAIGELMARDHASVWAMVRKVDEDERLLTEARTLLRQLS